MIIMSQQFAVEYPILPCPPKMCNIIKESKEFTETYKRLCECKERVKIVLHTHGEAAWRKAVFQQEPLWRTQIPRTCVASRAYFKMWEIAKACALPPPTRSLHLCEAPGGFVEACCDMYGENLDWYAASLQGGPTFVKHLQCERILSNMNNGNDILYPEVQQELVDRVLSKECKHPCDHPYFDLVTADGAAAMNHDNLEVEALPLLKAQVDIALKVLSKEGTFVLKFFEGCHPETRALLIDLCMRFDEVSLYKPTHSRPTNSERYIICRKLRALCNEVSEVETASDVHAWKQWSEQFYDIIASMCDDQYKALRTALLQVGTHNRNTKLPVSTSIVSANKRRKQHSRRVTPIVSSSR